jgi:hypothetical protein
MVVSFDFTPEPVPESVERRALDVAAAIADVDPTIVYLAPLYSVPLEEARDPRRQAKQAFHNRSPGW